MGDWNGTVPTILAGDIPTGDDWKNVLDELTALSAAWTAYTPVWGASGTQPVLGNGTLVGSYRRVGRTVNVNVKLTMGSTTTFGTGTYTLSLPVLAIAAVCAAGPLYILDAGTANRSGIAINSSTSVVQMVTSADTDVGQLVPQTFAVNDIIMFSMTYEAA